ncbi:MAG: HAD family phosphatase [Clostridia bacterium]|nr:HAD family phosphatase [Clostridia bacterium]
MKIKGAIFDVDGTLLDSMFTWRHRGELYLESLGITPREGLHLDVRRLGFIKSADMIKEEYNLPLSPDEIRDEMMKVVDNYYKTNPQVKKGTIEFLEELRKNGVKMCVATATDRHMVEPGLINAGIRHYFDEIFTCGGLGTNKTKPFIFEKAMEALGTSKEDTVIFEDALYAVKTAKKAGFFVTGIFDEQEPEQDQFRALCDVFVYNLQDSLKILL